MVSDKELNEFGKLLEYTTGIVLTRDGLTRYAPLLSKLADECFEGNCAALLGELKRQAGAGDVWVEITRAVTVGESYFLRDRGQIALLKDVILPRLIEEKRTTRSLRIVSAGCSSGEEPYTLRILLDQSLGSGAERGGWKIDVVGLDIDRGSLARAREGLYRKWSFRGSGDDIRERYFTSEGDEWRIRSEIRAGVRFLEHNLLRDALPDAGKNLLDIDLLICRNVFIYFTPEAISTVVKKFTGALREGGYLLCGHVELNGQELAGLEILQMPGSLVYRKGGARKKTSSAARKLTPSRMLGECSPPVRSKSPVVTSATMKRSESPLKEAIEPLDDVHALFKSGEYEGVIRELTSAAQSMILTEVEWSLLIEACASNGDLKQAREHCTQFIELNDLNPLPYYLLAHLEQDAGEVEEAKKLLRKVLYLNPDAVAAYLSLGTILDTEGRAEKAKKVRENALMVLSKLRGDEEVPLFDGVTAAELTGYVQTLIKSEA